MWLRKALQLLHGTTFVLIILILVTAVPFLNTSGPSNYWLHVVGRFWVLAILLGLSIGVFLSLVALLIWRLVKKIEGIEKQLVGSSTVIAIVWVPLIALSAIVTLLASLVFYTPLEAARIDGEVYYLSLREDFGDTVYTIHTCGQLALLCTQTVSFVNLPYRGEFVAVQYVSSGGFYIIESTSNAP